MKDSILEFLQFLLILLLVVAGVGAVVIPALAYTNQREIKITCGKSLCLIDALFYDLKAGGCPTVTIKKG